MPNISFGEMTERMSEDKLLSNLLIQQISVSSIPANGTSSAIDLSLCSPDVVDVLNWHVEDHLCGSRHYPITIGEINNLILLI